MFTDSSKTFGILRPQPLNDEARDLQWKEGEWVNWLGRISCALLSPQKLVMDYPFAGFSDVQDRF